jgi:hypothetical protein
MRPDVQPDAHEERSGTGEGRQPAGAADGYLAVLDRVLAGPVDDRDHELDEHVVVRGQEPPVALPVAAGVADAGQVVEVVADPAGLADMDHAPPQTSILETGDTASCCSHATNHGLLRA